MRKIIEGCAEVLEYEDGLLTDGDLIVRFVDADQAIELGMMMKALGGLTIGATRRKFFALGEEIRAVAARSVGGH